MDCQKTPRRPDAYEGLPPPKPVRPHINLKLIIFTLVAVGVLLGSGWRLTSQAFHHLTTLQTLTSHGEKITGVVISKRGVLSTFGMDYTVLYRYQLEQSHTARSRVSRALFQNAGPDTWVAIYYDPDRPAISMLDLDFNRKPAIYLPGLITGPILTLAGLAVFFCLLSEKIRSRLKERFKKKDK